MARPTAETDTMNPEPPSSIEGLLRLKMTLREAGDARPMSLIIRENIKKPLANELLFGQLVNGGAVRVKVEGEELGFEVATKTT